MWKSKTVLSFPQLIPQLWKVDFSLIKRKIESLRKSRKRFSTKLAIPDGCGEADIFHVENEKSPWGKQVEKTIQINFIETILEAIHETDEIYSGTCGDCGSDPL